MAASAFGFPVATGSSGAGITFPKSRSLAMWAGTLERP